MRTLFVVSTPIGNLEDVSPRAIRVLGEVGLIAAEDTRVTRKLLDAHGVRTPMVSCHDFSSSVQIDRLVSRLETDDVALVTDAGTPGVSDPGFALVRSALAAGARVVPIPGPSAVLAALVASGLPMHEFTFLGFVPRKSGQRRRMLEEVRDSPRTTVLYESPHRIIQTLDALVEIVGADRHVAVARELTKVFEEVTRGPAADVLDRLRAQAPRGEFTIVVSGADYRPRHQET
jgi:16S rRNA (cytidine1402-2'-O)-methyltransferase